MFESIGIRRIKHADTINPVDIGFIAESMLFYKKVRVLADHVVLKKIVRDINPTDLILLLDEGYLEIEYIPNSPAIANESSSLGDCKNVVLIGLVKEIDEMVFESLYSSSGRRGYSKRNASRIAEHISTNSFENALVTEINQDFQNINYLKMSVKSIINDLVPEYQLDNDFKFVQHKTPKGLVTETNLNFEAINTIFHQYIHPTQSTINDSYLLSHIANVRTEIHLATKYESEIATDFMYSNVMQIFMNNLISKVNKNNENINSFQKFIFENGKNLRSAINNNECELKDLIKVLQKANKFKKWINELDHDKSLIKEYYKEVTSSSFIDKLPGKSIRWALFTGVGVAIDAVVTGGFGTIAGLALGAGDSLILDKLIKKWKPNHFVDNEFQKIINKSA